MSYGIVMYLKKIVKNTCAYYHNRPFHFKWKLYFDLIQKNNLVKRSIYRCHECFITSRNATISTFITFYLWSWKLMCAERKNCLRIIFYYFSHKPNQPVSQIHFHNKWNKVGTRYHISNEYHSSILSHVGVYQFFNYCPEIPWFPYFIHLCKCHRTHLSVFIGFVCTILIWYECN